MNSARDLKEKIDLLKTQDIPLSEKIWQAALVCIGWPYVYGAWGEECNPEKRGRRVSSKHPKTKEKCQVLNGSRSDCKGCRWYPDFERVLMNDCRGFTGYLLEQFGIKISKTGATSQWNGDYWEAKGKVSDGVPDDVLVCLFYPDKEEPSKMAHTGFGFRGATCECSEGVEYEPKREKKWTHWAIPRGIGGTPGDYRPTLRKGDKGAYVTLLQTELLNRGYSLPKYGADGSFGNETLKAVLAFQGDAGLKQDGIVGAETWAALDGEQPEKYTVTIPHLVKSEAAGLVERYAGAYMTKEG